MADISKINGYDIKDKVAREELTKKVNTEDLSQVSISGDYNDLENKPFYDSGNNVILEIPAEKMRAVINKANEEGEYGWGYLDAPNDMFSIMKENLDKDYYAIFDNRVSKIEFEYDPDDYDYCQCLFFYVYSGYSYDEETSDWIDNEQSMIIELDPMVSTNVLPENITSLAIVELNIKELDNKFLPSDLKILNSISVGRCEYSDIGDFSAAIGVYTKAEGYSAIATGIGSLATGDASHAEGGWTEAKGNYSHSEGNDTVAEGGSSHAEGYGSKAHGDMSHAEGDSRTHGSWSHAEGRLTTALGEGAHSEGYGGQYGSSVIAAFKDISIDDITSGMMLGEWKAFITGHTVALKQGAHAEGRSTLASGEGAHSEGWGTCALDNGAHSEGNYTTALGYTSHAEGSSTSKAANAFDGGYIVEASDEEILEKWDNKKFSLAKGRGSHSEGTDTLALGDSAHAEGYETTASAQYSHAEGCCTQATSSAAHAEGDSTKATRIGAHSEGVLTEADGYASHAEGCGTIARGDGQHVQGYYNIEDEDEIYIHIVGNGSRNTRSNAHTLDWDGNAWFAGNVSVGINNKQLATEDYVQEEIRKMQIGDTEIENYDDTELRDMIALKADKTELFSKDYNDLKNKPEIPTVSNDLTDELKAKYDTVYEFVGSGLVNMTSIDGSAGNILVAHYPTDGPNTVFYSSKISVSSSGSLTTESNMNAKTFYEDGKSLSNKYAAIENVLAKDNTVEYTPVNEYNPATKKYVDNAVAGLVESAPETLDTLNELAQALGDDPNFATTVSTEIGKKVNTEDLSTVATSGAYEDLLNKPFYETKVVESVSLNFDGDLTDKEISGYDDLKFVKVTDEVYKEDVDAIINSGLATLYIQNTGDKNIDLSQTDHEFEEMNENLYLLAEFIVVALDNVTLNSDEDDEVLFSFTKGIWFGVIPNYAFMKSLSFDRTIANIRNQSDTYTLNSNGDVWYAGNVFVGSDSKQLATEEFVNEKVENTLLKTEQILTDDEKNQVRENLGFIGKTAVVGEKITVDGTTHTVEENAEIVGDYANNKAIGAWSFAAGSENIAVGRASHVEGAMNKAIGTGSHVEGIQCTATGFWSHAEGERTKVTSYASHAEGSYTTLPDGTTSYGTASGYASHVEGGGCHATGSCAHVEGGGCRANGACSHAEGRYTVASGISQHVEGVANIEDTENKYIHIAGNGSWEQGVQNPTRSNAYTLDWSGNAWYAGNISIGADKKQLATEEFVNNKVMTITEEEVDQLIIDIFGSEYLN